MKQVFVLMFLMSVSVLMYGQAIEGTVESQRKQQPAAIIELPYAPDVVKAAMSDYLSKKGKSKGNDLKGFTTYRNTQPMQNDSANADMFFKIERKSRQEKSNTTVSMLVSTPPTEGAVASNLNYMNMEEAKAYLNDLVPAIEAYNLEMMIKDQNESLIKAEAKLKSLVSDEADLEDKKKNIEKRLNDNKSEQQKQSAEIENQKQKLAAWVNQRKS